MIRGCTTHTPKALSHQTTEDQSLTSLITTYTTSLEPASSVLFPATCCKSARAIESASSPNNRCATSSNPACTPPDRPSVTHNRNNTGAADRADEGEQEEKVKSATTCQEERDAAPRTALLHGEHRIRLGHGFIKYFACLACTQALGKGRSNGIFNTICTSNGARNFCELLVGRGKVY